MSETNKFDVSGRLTTPPHRSILIRELKFEEEVWGRAGTATDLYPALRKGTGPASISLIPRSTAE